MKRFQLFILVCLSLFDTATIQAKPGSLLKLWYDKPAAKWEEALPIGNGRLGAMVFGSPEHEHLQLNEETVWAGEPGNNLPKGFKEILPQVRKLIFEGKYQEAQDLTMTRFPRYSPKDNNYGMPYQTVGDLWIDIPNAEKVNGYSRDLDIQNAISTVSYQIGETTFQREYFASVADQVIAVKFTASKKGKISFTIRANSPHTQYQVKAVGAELVMTGKGEPADNKAGKIEFNARFLPKIEGGEIEKTDSSLVVKNANSAIIYISIATNFKSYNDVSGNAEEKSKAYLAGISTKSYDKIKQAHITNYRKYFDRVQLDLGSTSATQKPTDQRIKEFATSNDPQLVSLYFQFGRYLLISSSQPGTQPANLQGIWNYKLNPPWDSKYTVNINTEMNYWPAEVTNLTEMHQPLFSMLKDLAVAGKDAAREMYGARGWMLHHNTDIWRITGPVDGAFYGMWPMGGAWLSQHLWQHFLYTGDTKFLEEVYPILKGAAMFYVDALQTEPTHNWLVVAPCMSPENAHRNSVSMAAGNTMDNQLVFDVFSNLEQASSILQTDSTFADTVKAMRDRLPPMQIGQYNQLQEWLFDWDRPDDHHRHVSHLYGLFPSNQISPFANPQLFEAARNTLVYRGDKSTGWSMGWKVNFWARLLDGNRAYKLIQEQLSPAPEAQSGQDGGTYPNLFDAHPPFQIDGNFGCTSGIAEMLVQSHDGAIHLLPALPDALPSGKVTGLCTRGGFIIDMSWENGKVKELTVKSTLGGNCRLRIADQLSGKVKLVSVKESEVNPNILLSTAPVKKPLISPKAQLKLKPVSQTQLFDFETQKGKTYQFYSIKN